MDTKTEIKRIEREIAAVTGPDHAMQDRALAGAGMKVPNHFNKAGVSGSPARARAEHAENDRRKVAPPIIKKP